MTNIYLNLNDPALGELEKRIAAKGRLGQTVTYTDLVRGIAFQPKNARIGAAYYIYEWHDVNRAIITEYLSHLSTQSQTKHGFLASSLVVSEQENIPSSPFFALAKKLGVMKAKEDKTFFWIGEINKAHAFYQQVPAFYPKAPQAAVPAQSTVPVAPGVIASPLKTLQDKVARYLATLQWQFVLQNPGALLQMERRIDQAIANQVLLTYSQLVDGIDFYLPQSQLSAPYRIEHKDWNGSVGGMVGEFLCYISMQSFVRRGVLSSAVVVKSNGKISSGFLELSKLLGLLKRIDDATDDAFWQLEKGYVYAPQTISSRTVPYK